MTADPLYPLYPSVALVAAALALIPLPWHFHAWNAGTCVYIFWAALSCVNFGVNAIVWREGVKNVAPVWCDVSSRVILGTAVGIPAASLCINRRLYKIASVSVVVMSRDDKKRAVLEDLAIGLGLPAIQIAVAYIVMGHRFDIYEGVGCFPAIHNVWLSYVLVSSWPIVIGLISAVYCVLSLRGFAKRNRQLRILLSASSSIFPLGRYFRLMGLAATELLATVPFASYAIYTNITVVGVKPYRGWTDTHYGWSRVGLFPSALWRTVGELGIGMEMTRWLPVACALMFFVFFGFAEEARKNYARLWITMCNAPGMRQIIARRELKSPKGVVPVTTHSDVYPVTIPQPNSYYGSIRSLGSFSSGMTTPSTQRHFSIDEIAKPKAAIVSDIA